MPLQLRPAPTSELVVSIGSPCDGAASRITPTSGFNLDGCQMRGHLFVEACLVVLQVSMHRASRLAPRLPGARESHVGFLRLICESQGKKGAVTICFQATVEGEPFRRRLKTSCECSKVPRPSAVN